MPTVTTGTSVTITSGTAITGSSPSGSGGRLFAFLYWDAGVSATVSANTGADWTSLGFHGPSNAEDWEVFYSDEASPDWQFNFSTAPSGALLVPVRLPDADTGTAPDFEGFSLGFDRDNPADVGDSTTSFGDGIAILGINEGDNAANDWNITGGYTEMYANDTPTGAGFQLGRFWLGYATNLQASGTVDFSTFDHRTTPPTGSWRGGIRLVQAESAGGPTEVTAGATSHTWSWSVTGDAAVTAEAQATAHTWAWSVTGTPELTHEVAATAHTWAWSVTGTPELTLEAGATVHTWAWSVSGDATVAVEAAATAHTWAWSVTGTGQVDGDVTGSGSVVWAWSVSGDAAVTAEAAATAHTWAWSVSGDAAVTVEAQPTAHTWAWSVTGDAAVTVEAQSTAHTWAWSVAGAPELTLEVASTAHTWAWAVAGTALALSTDTPLGGTAVALAGPSRAEAMSAPSRAVGLSSLSRAAVATI